MAVRNTPINGIETDLEKQLVDAIEFDEQCDKQAAARIAELVKKDRLLKVENQECLRQTFSCLPNKVFIQPTSPQASYAKCYSLFFFNLINTNMIFNGKVFRFK